MTAAVPVDVHEHAALCEPPANSSQMDDAQSTSEYADEQPDACVVLSPPPCDLRTFLRLAQPIVERAKYIRKYNTEAHDRYTPVEDVPDDARVGVGEYQIGKAVLDHAKEFNHWWRTDVTRCGELLQDDADVAWAFLGTWNTMLERIGREHSVDPNTHPDVIEHGARLARSAYVDSEGLIRLDRDTFAALLKATREADGMIIVRGDLSVYAKRAQLARTVGLLGRLKRTRDYTLGWYPRSGTLVFRWARGQYRMPMRPERDTRGRVVINLDRATASRALDAGEAAPRINTGVVAAPEIVVVEWVSAEATMSEQSKIDVLADLERYGWKMATGYGKLAVVTLYSKGNVKLGSGKAAKVTEAYAEARDKALEAQKQAPKGKGKASEKAPDKQADAQTF